jgi:hypothetical protein
MIRNLKAIGLAVVAVLAISAFVASAASAQSTTHKFTAMDNIYPKAFHGANAAGQETFITEAGTVECASTFTGAIASATQHVVVSPVYSSCKAFGFLNATVTMHDCSYTFQLTTRATSPTVHYQAHVNLLCPAGKSVTIKAGTCEVLIHPQNNLTTVDIENNAATTDILVRATVAQALSYTVTADGFGCPFAGTGAKTGGSYTSHSATTITASGGIHIG